MKILNLCHPMTWAIKFGNDGIISVMIYGVKYFFYEAKKSGGGSIVDAVERCGFVLSEIYPFIHILFLFSVLVYQYERHCAL